MSKIFYNVLVRAIKKPRTRRIFSLDVHDKRMFSTCQEVLANFFDFLGGIMDIVDKIDELCKKHGTTINSLEKELGLGHGSIPKWRNVSPRCVNVLAVANKFNVTTDSLIRDDWIATPSTGFFSSSYTNNRDTELLNLIHQLSDEGIENVHKYITERITLGYIKNSAARMA